MLAPSERPLPPDVAAALDHARTVCDALGVLDALHSKMHKFVQMVTLQLQQTDGGAPVELPNRKDYLNKLDKQSSKRPARQRAFDAMDAVLAVGWPSLPAMTNAEKQVRKRQKQRHNAVQPRLAAVLPDYALSDRPPVDGSTLLDAPSVHATGVLSAHEPSAFVAGDIDHKPLGLCPTLCRLPPLPPPPRPPPLSPPSRPPSLSLPPRSSSASPPSRPSLTSSPLPSASLAAATLSAYLAAATPAASLAAATPSLSFAAVLLFASLAAASPMSASTPAHPRTTPPLCPTCSVCVLTRRCCGAAHRLVRHGAVIAFSVDRCRDARRGRHHRSAGVSAHTHPPRLTR